MYDDLGLTARWYIVLRWMLSHFEEMENYISPDAKVLDIGCGYGLFVNLVSLKGDKRHAAGLDTSHERISIAARSAQNRKNISFIEKDVAEMDFAPYDTVTFSDVLHHFSYSAQEELLKKIHRQIRKGAVVLIKELDTRPFLKYYISYVLDTFLYLGQRISYRSLDSWKNVLNKIGFDVEAVILHKTTILSSVLYVCKKR